MSDFDIMKEWVRERANYVSLQLNALAEQHGYSPSCLTSPAYRALLGQHQAYMHMLSFIHGAAKNSAEIEAMAYCSPSSSESVGK